MVTVVFSVAGDVSLTVRPSLVIAVKLVISGRPETGERINENRRKKMRKTNKKTKKLEPPPPLHTYLPLGWVKTLRN